MSTEVDVVVVGGGPAGAAAAHLLATRGRSVIVCERSHFPRDKACGDGLTPRAVRVLDEMGLGPQLRSWQQVRGVRIHARGRTREFAFPSDGRWPPMGVVRRRRDLDHAVLGQARAAGAEVVHGAEVSGFVREGETVVGVVVGHDGASEQVRASWVLCAGGAGGPLARSLGRTMPPGAPRALAARQYFPRPIGRSGWFDVYTDTRLDGHPVPGYGWVFPVGDGMANAGVGLVTTPPRWQGANLHRLQRSFLETLPPSSGILPEAALSPLRAGRVPMGAGVWPPHGPGFLLVGDAAAMVNPASGEGIAYALETGQMAARHVDEALVRGSSPSLESYTEELRATYGSYFRLGRGLLTMVGHPLLAVPAVAGTMLSQASFGLAMTMILNLDDDRPKWAQRAFRLLESGAKLTG